MIKKLSIILFIIVLIFSPTTFANDGGAYTAGAEKLEVIIKPKTNTLEIGEKFTVQMILKNNDIYPILLDHISYMLDGMYIGIDGEDIPSSDIFINPGTSAYYDVSFIVDETINWYVKDGKYYVDVNPLIYYEAVIQDPPADFIFDRDCAMSDYYWEFYNKDITPIPIEITNLNDGSDMAEIEIPEAIETIYFYYSEESDDNAYDGEYTAELSQAIIVKNTSNEDIPEIYVPSGRWKKTSDDTFTLGKSEKIVQIVTKGFFLKPENIPDELKVYYRAIIKKSGKYYGVIKEVEIKAHFWEPPQIKFDFYQIDDNGDTGICMMVMENISGAQYENFVYYEDIQEIMTNIDDVYIEKYIMKSGDKMVIPLYFNVSEQHQSFNIGFLADNIVYLWSVSFYYSNGEITDISIFPSLREYPISMYINDLPSALTKSPSTTPAPETAMPKTPAPTAIATANVQENTPEVPCAFSPTPVTDGTEIVKTNERPNIPAWIYTAFIAAGAAVCIMIYLMIKKNKDKQSTD